MSETSTAPSARRVLGDVSPNVRKTLPPAHFNSAHNKPAASSPLKRSFTAAIENSHGFTYLKRRKGSFDGRLGSSEQTLGQLKDRLSPDLTTTAVPSPTEVNTPSCSGEEVPTEGRGDASQPAEHHSFSSLINYDASSQPISTSQQRAPRLLFNGPSMAELLRLRLQVAMYKIRTNQIGIAFDDLHVEEDEDEAGDDEVEERRRTTRESTLEAETVEDIVARRREDSRAASIPSSGAAIPKLLPAPTLLPTACSSRMIYQESAPLPSSPPILASPERESNCVGPAQ